MKKILIINIILIILIYLLPNKSATEPTIETTETAIEPIAETLLAEPTIIETPTAEPVAEIPPVVETPVEDKTLTGYRITSYYPSESSNTTGSGKTTNDFSFIDIGGKKVYSYQGKIVVAAATNELLKSGYSINRFSK